MLIIFLEKQVLQGKKHIVCIEAKNQQDLDSEAAIYTSDGWVQSSQANFDNQSTFSSHRGNVSTPNIGDFGKTLVKSGIIAILNDDAGNPLSITGIGFRPSVIYFIGSDNQKLSINSNGWTDGVNSASTSMRETVLDSSFTYPIDVSAVIGNGNGWKATVVMDNDGFTLTKTKVGVGSNITIKFMAIK